MTNRVRLTLPQTLLVGSLVFGLFFGAGNLIFPVGMGREAAAATPLATVGFLITAVGLPMLGLIASALARAGSVRELVAPVGRAYALLFTCALYLTIGPAFAIPRTATVSYEIGVHPLLPAGAGGWALLAFTAAFFGLVAVFALRPGRLIDWVGRYLTPLFLVLLAGLLVAAYARPMTTAPLGPPAPAYAAAPLAKGLVDGYNTMDALASLAFAIVIIEAIRGLGVTAPAAIASTMARAGLVAVIGMGVIYAALAHLGATSVGALPEAGKGGAILAGASRHFYGPTGQVLVAAIVLAACLKTAIGLVTACAEMFSELFGHEHRIWVLLFTAVSLVIANFGLEAIIGLSVPVLVFLYPLAITAIILGLLAPVLRGRRWPHRFMTGLVAVAALADLVTALPEGTPGRSAVVDVATATLPGYAVGFGWVVPAIVGLALGVVVSALAREPSK